MENGNQRSADMPEAGALRRMDGSRVHHPEEDGIGEQGVIMRKLMELSWTGLAVRFQLVLLFLAAVVLVPTHASAHHRQVFDEPLGFYVTGICMEPEPEPYLEVSGAVVLTLEREFETEIARMRVIWRYYTKEHPSGIPDPDAEWVLTDVKRDSVLTSQSRILSSWFSNRLGWSEDLDKRLTVTVQWASYLGQVATHRKLVSQWSYFAEGDRCYAYQPK